ncbi:MAG TPA: hypothetical protein VGW79_03865, partial [Actinomycetota bacterium]|nr:hypothetical protein [Actinomycetota bacterium]
MIAIKPKPSPAMAAAIPMMTHVPAPIFAIKTFVPPASRWKSLEIEEHSGLPRPDEVVTRATEEHAEDHED